MPSFKQSFFRNIFISGGFTYLTQLVLFIASFVTSRLITPQEFGLIGLITVFSGFITIFSDSGITMAVIRSPYKERFYRGIHVVSIITGIVLSVITLIIVYPISLFYNNRELILPAISIAFLFIFKSFSIVPNAVLQKDMRFKTYGIILFLSTLAGTLITVLLAYYKFKYWSLIWSQYVTAFLSFVILRKKLPVIFSIPKKAVVKKSFVLAKTLIGSLISFNTINYWARNADNLIVGKFYGTNDLGIYNRAYMMLQMPLNLISGIFSSVLLPSFVKHKKNGGNIEDEFKFILRIISLINLPVALLLIIFPTQLVSLLWGAKWQTVAELLPYFGLLVMTQSLTSTLGSLLVVENKEKTLMLSGWINSIFIMAGIVIGAFFSLESIAAYYSLFFIALVLPFCVIYIFSVKLQFRNVNMFWFIRILLSLTIWAGIFYDVKQMLLTGMIIWSVIVVWDIKKELKSFIDRYVRKLGVQ